MKFISEIVQRKRQMERETERDGEKERERETDRERWRDGERERVRRREREVTVVIQYLSYFINESRWAVFLSS